MNKSDLHVGQKVYLQPKGSNTRYYTELKEGVVDHIGNKYFTIKGYWGDRFIIDTMLHDGKGYSPGWKVWISLEDYENYKLLCDYSSKLGRRSSDEFARLGLDKLKIIMDLISK